MGQIKNIKLHIVTDIKYTFHKLVESQQVSHAVCTMWTFVVPHTEEGVCVVWVPQCTNSKFQLGFQGEEKKDDWYRPYATYEEGSSAQYQRIQRRNVRQVSEEGRSTIDNCTC